MAANRHIRKGTVLAFTTPKGIEGYVYVARRHPNANHGLGYVYVADGVDLAEGLIAADAMTCVHMGFKDTVGDWPVVAQQVHDDEDWPIPKMYMDAPGADGEMLYRLDTFAGETLRFVRSEKATAQECAGRPEASAFHAGAVPYWLDKVLAKDYGRFGDMAWWQALRAGATDEPT